MPSLPKFLEPYFACDLPQKPALLFVDNFLSLGKLLPLATLFSKAQVPYQLLWTDDFDVEPLIQEYESVTQIKVNRKKIAAFEVSGIQARVEGRLRRSGAGRIAADLQKFRRVKNRLRAHLDVNSYSSVIVVLYNKMSAGRILLKECQERELFSVGIVGRTLAREELVRVLGDQYEDFLFRSSRSKTLLSMVFGKENIFERSDGTMVIPAHLTHLMSMKVFTPEDHEYYWPISVYPSRLIFHPAINNQATEQDPLPQVPHQLHRFPEEVLLENPVSAHFDQWLNQLRDYQKQNRCKVLLCGISDSTAEQYTQSLDEERSYYEEIVHRVCAMPGWAVVICKHPRTFWKSYSERMERYQLPNLFVSPYTGMMMVPYCDAVLSFPSSELNVYAEYYGAKSVYLNPTNHPYENAWIEHLQKRRHHAIIQAMNLDEAIGAFEEVKESQLKLVPEGRSYPNGTDEKPQMMPHGVVSK